MVCCIQMYLKTKNVAWDLLDENDEVFSNLYNVVDDLMKDHLSHGLGHVNSATPIENNMWTNALADPGGATGERPPSTQILSFLHTNFPQCHHVGPWHPPYGVGAPTFDILYSSLQWYSWGTQSKTATWYYIFLTWCEFCITWWDWA